MKSTDKAGADSIYEKQRVNKREETREKTEIFK